MRFAIITVLLCACAPFSSVRRTTLVEAERNYAEFYKEFAAGNYDTAKTIVDHKGVDRQRVTDLALLAMWEYVDRENVFGALEVADKFLDSKTRLDFAQIAFQLAMARKDGHEVAIDIVFLFNLDKTYFESVVVSEKIQNGLQAAVLLSCRRLSAQDNSLLDLSVEQFQQVSAQLRDYDDMEEIAQACLLSKDQLLNLFSLGMKEERFQFVMELLDGQTVFNASFNFQPLYKQLYQATIAGVQLNVAERLLDDSSFSKTSADYDVFIATAIARLKCDNAVMVAVDNHLPDSVIEGLFLNPACFSAKFQVVGFTFRIHKDRVDWYFDLSLRAQKFALARLLIQSFSLGKKYFDRLVIECLITQDFEEVLNFEPWSGETSESYRDGLLNRILELDEEWFVVRFVTYRSDLFSAVRINTWIERSFLHSLRRGMFDLAADIAIKHSRKDWGIWAIRLAFDQAVLAKDADAAKLIAKRWNLGKEATRQAVLLGWENSRKEIDKQAQELRRRKKRNCKSADTWSVEPCK